MFPYNESEWEFISVIKDNGYKIKITVEDTTRSIIVRGHKPDLDVIDSVIREIDVKTRQVLIEAFIVEATSDFQKRFWFYL